MERPGRGSSNAVPGEDSRRSETERDAGERDRLFQRQARALGDATRYRIFRYVADAGGSVGVADITAHAGINHNSVRQHLAKLCAADLVIEEAVRSGGPGRPALRYRPAPGSAALSGGTSPYEHLAVLLLEVLEGRTPAEVGAAAGRRAIPSVTGDADPLEVLEAEMRRHGFPSHREDTGTSVELVVSHCPLAAAATANSDIVCGLHQGMTQGMVDALGGGMLHVGLIRRDPRTGGCRIQLERPAVGDP